MSFIYTFKTKEITLRKGVPLAVIQFLDEAINGKGKRWSDLTPPSHPFFETERWMSVFGQWHWIDTDPHTYFKKRGAHHRLYIHCDINYCDEEIAQFADWITPFVAGHKPKEYIGWYKHDGSDYGERNNVYIERKNPENSGHHPNL